MTGMRHILYRPDGTRRLGTKGVVALALGGLAAARGFGYIDPETVPDGLTTLDGIFPLEWWGWIWVAVGLASLIAGLIRMENAAFVGIAVVNAAWAMSYTYEWASQWVIDRVFGRDWITAVSYASQVVVIIAVVRLIDPMDVARCRGRPERGEDA